MPMAAGGAAHERHVSLAAGDADGRPANDVNRQLKSYRGGRIPNGIRCHPARRPEGARSAVRFMISLASWWWPKRPARVPRARTAVLLTGLGAALFAVAALLLKAEAVGWDVSLFRILNQVPAAAASVLTLLSHLFLPAGILAVVVLAVVYVVARNRSVLPVAAGAVAASLAWGLAHVAKAVADRPRPYEVMAGAVLRQQPAHGTSFPSSHTAVTLAVAIALAPFLARPFAAAGIGYAVLVGWSRVYLGVHYPLDVLAGAGIGMAAGGFDRAGGRGAAPPRRPDREQPQRRYGGTGPQGRARAPRRFQRTAGAALAEGAGGVHD